MSEKISKELLSLVLDKNIDSVGNVKDNQDELFCENILEFYPSQEGNPYILPNGKLTTINLDTLGRLCKEWCWKQDYVIKTVHYGEKVTVGFASTSDFGTHYKNEVQGVIEYTNKVAKIKGLL